jgi:hypothetical protein
VEFAEEGVNSYHVIGKYFLNPSLVYAAIRFASYVAGIGPEINSVEPAFLDALFFATLFNASIYKGLEALLKVTDLKSARKEYAEAKERLGMVNNNC